MEQIRQWAMMVCLTCITAGVLQQFTRVKKQVSGIKLVLALYILVTALSPISGFAKTLDFAPISSVEPAESLDTEHQALRVAQQELSAQLEEELSSHKIAADVAVELAVEENGKVEIQQIEVFTSADQETVRSCIESALETQVPLTINVLGKDS